MKKIIIILVAISVVSVCSFFYVKNIVYGVQISKTTEIYIKTTDSLAQVIKTLNPIVNSIEDVKKVIRLKKYKKIKAGRYLLKQGTNTNSLVNILRSGKQTPVKVVFNNQHNIASLAGRLGVQIEADSVAIINSLLDPQFLKNNYLNSKTVINICMPYSYECYWNIKPTQLRAKFLHAYQQFWSSKNIKKAKSLGLTQNQVISLAAIVQKESQYKPERKRIAGVYLNRVKKGILLQADPTVIYAAKEVYGENYDIKRVLNKHKKIDSPYNTYLNKGIPPSAIAMPDIDAIAAVLNAENHDYLFFCADTKYVGRHLFAKNYRTHLRNAKKYHQRMNALKIFK